MTLELWAGLLLSVAGFAYLLYAMIRPEEF
jgi:K+-transporting ATPase KdpF subunit